MLTCSIAFLQQIIRADDFECTYYAFFNSLSPFLICNAYFRPIIMVIMLYNYVSICQKRAR